MSTQDIRTRATVIAMFAAVALLAACGTDGGADTAAVRTADNPGIGTVLVDRSGKTLYFTDQEADGTIQCVDDCLGFWFPAESSDATAPAGVHGLDVLRRDDNARQQLTFQGKPLYTFRLDTSEGDAKGNDVEDDFGGTHFVWHAVTVDGAAPTSGGDDGGGYGGGGY